MKTLRVTWHWHIWVTWLQPLCHVILNFESKTNQAFPKYTHTDFNFIKINNTTIKVLLKLQRILCISFLFTLELNLLKQNRNNQFKIYNLSRRFRCPHKIRILIFKYTYIINSSLSSHGLENDRLFPHSIEVYTKY